MLISVLCLALGFVACNRGDVEVPVVGTEGLEYTLSRYGKYYIATGMGTCTASEIVIGNTYNQLPVKEVGYRAFEYCQELISVTIPNGVVSIGVAAFWECDGLTSVTMADTLINIESAAFYDCRGLTSVIMSNRVTHIGYEAFFYCNKLTEIRIPNSVYLIGRNVFRGCSGLTSVTFENVDEWEVLSWSGISTEISSNDISDPAIAAEFLTSTYGEYQWQRYYGKRG